MWLRADPSDSGFRTSPLMRYFFAKSLIVNQIRLFRLFPPFSIFQQIRLLEFPALVTITDKDGRRLGLFDIGVYSYDDWRKEIESYTDTVEVVFRTDVSGSDMG